MTDAEKALGTVVAMFAEIGVSPAIPEPDTLLRRLVDVAAHRVAGAEFVSATVYQGGGFTTAAASHDIARQADKHQFDLGAGPCIDATTQARGCHSPDLGADSRWPGFSGWARGGGLRCALCVGIGDADHPIGLNLYASHARAFDAEALQLASVLGSYARTALAAAQSATSEHNLRKALGTNKDIGVAIGLIMAKYRCTHDQAMEMLRQTSQLTNRKVSDLAAYVVSTGALPGKGGTPR